MANTAILILEAEYLIALDIQRMLSDLNLGEATVAHTVDAADAALDRLESVALAVAEVRSGSPKSVAFATRLAELGIPLILSTAELGVRRELSRKFEAPILIKPFSDQALGEAVRAAMRRSADTLPSL